MTVSTGECPSAPPRSDAMRMRPAPDLATRGARAGSAVNPRTSLMIDAPASRAARAGSARLVSAETGTPSFEARMPTAQPSRSVSSEAEMEPDR